MVLSRSTPAARKEKARRRRFAATKDHPETIKLCKAPAREFFITLGPPRDVAGFQDLKTNLTLLDKDTQQPLLQRLSPTSPDKLSDAIKSAKVGLEAFKLLKSLHAPVEGRGLYHLGYWHSTGQGYLGMTKQTTNKRKQEPESALPLLAWAKNHSYSFLSHLLPLLHPIYQVALEERKLGRENLMAGHINAKDYTHDWWTGVSFFDSFTGGDHLDRKDAQPSFLFNFGSPCILRLHDYMVDIQLDPYDVAIFNTAAIYHSTMAVPGQEEDMERWAFSAWFRLSIKDMKPVIQVREERVQETGGGPNTRRIRFTY